VIYPALSGLTDQFEATLIAEKRRRTAELSLYEFVKQAWHVVEPGVPFVHGWHLEIICEHLQAITDG